MGLRPADRVNGDWRLEVRLDCKRMVLGFRILRTRMGVAF
jgi:hypothetical protein